MCHNDRIAELYSSYITTETCNGWQILKYSVTKHLVRNIQNKKGGANIIEHTYAENLFAVIILAVAIYLVKQNNIMTKQKSRQYLSVLIFSLGLVLLQYCAVQVINKPPSVISYWFLSIVFLLEYALSPLILIFISFICHKKLKQHAFKILFPISFFWMISLSNPWSNLIFTFSQNYSFVKGPLFHINQLVFFYSFFIFVFSIFKQSNAHDTDEKMYLNIISLILVLGNLIQFFVPTRKIIWNCIALSLLLYYVFLQELQFKCDSVTNLYNRSTFEKAIAKLAYDDKLGIIMLDLNNLKTVNDSFGHSHGDRLISVAANIIKTAFLHVGTAYRIGGDEFCVLCKNATQAMIETCLNQIEPLCKQAEITERVHVSLAYGYKIYSSYGNMTIADAVAQADIEMYVHKLTFKTKGKKRVVQFKRPINFNTYSKH